MEGFTDAMTGEARRGFMEVVNELEQRFPDPAAIEKESDKKQFAKLFGEYLRVENVLQNYDEFASLKALQNVDSSDPAAVEAFKAQHYLSDEDLAALQSVKIPAERIIQDYRSTYNDIRDWLRRQKAVAAKETSTLDWDDVVFEAEALIAAEELNPEAARRYITTSLKREFASDNGTELNAILPKMSPLNPQYLTKKQSVFQKIAAFVEKFKEVGGSLLS
jgi:type I restriction enzyme R subunit